MVKRLCAATQRVRVVTAATIWLKRTDKGRRYDAVSKSHGIVVTHHLDREFPCRDRKRLCPSAITIWRYTASPGFDLGNEGIVLDANLFSEIALRQALLLPEAFQPLSSIASEHAYFLIGQLLWARMHVSIGDHLGLSILASKRESIEGQ